MEITLSDGVIVVIALSALGWAWKLQGQIGDYKTDIAVLQEKVKENFRQDSERNIREDKVWIAIKEINDAIHDLKLDIGVIKNSLTKK